jgi:hypothetical protein
MPIRDWNAALRRFAIVYENRMPADLSERLIKVKLKTRSSTQEI